MPEEKMRVPYALSVYDEQEINAVVEVLRNRKTIMGEKTKEFESKVASLFGKKYGIMVNSGSSANLLAVELLRLPKGSEAVTPAVTFSTTVAPLVQKGLKPVFVDVEIDTCIVDTRQLEDSITGSTKAFMIPYLFGNIPDVTFISRLAKDNGIKFIEDSCDTIGATYDGVPTGNYSDISTTSFYGSHVITAAGGGGMVCLNDEGMSRRCRVLRGWGRSSAVDETEDIKKRFGVQLEGMQYDSKFIFEELGYNFLPLEICSAFGLVQLAKLHEFRRIRQKRFRELVEFFSSYGEFFITPRQSGRVDTAWMHFPLTIKSGAPFSRLDMVTVLEENNIQTRPIFTGNVLRQPGFRGLSDLKKDFPNADYIMKNGFLIGCHHGMTDTHVNYLKKVFSTFLDRF